NKPLNRNQNQRFLRKPVEDRQSGRGHGAELPPGSTLFPLPKSVTTGSPEAYRTVLFEPSTLTSVADSTLTWLSLPVMVSKAQEPVSATVALLATTFTLRPPHSWSTVPPSVAMVMSSSVTSAPPSDDPGLPPPEISISVVPSPT